MLENLARFQGVLGIAFVVFLAWIFSENKKSFSGRFLAQTLFCQVAVAVLFVFLVLSESDFDPFSSFTNMIQAAKEDATGFVFGYIGGGDVPFEVTNPSANFSFAFQALPLIIIMSALMGLLWHSGVLVLVTRSIGSLLSRFVGVGGAVSIASVANVLLGQTESLLFVRQYIALFSRSELFAIMTVGLSTTSGAVLFLYVAIIGPSLPSGMTHLILASLMSVPAGLLIAKVMVPPSNDEIGADAKSVEPSKFSGYVDAFMCGAQDGMQLFLNIVASLLASIAFVSLIDLLLAAILPDFGGASLSIDRMLGWFFAPIMWMAGVSWEDAAAAGQLMGVKSALNEVIGFVRLSEMAPGEISDRSRLLVLYAMCGFANVGSLGVLIAGYGVLIPSRRSEIVALAPKALVSGTLASIMTAAVIGIVIY